MRAASLYVAVGISGLLWAEPFGPWSPAVPPAAGLSASSSAVVGPDTLTLEVFAWRDYMPRSVGGCGAPGSPAHPLWMSVSLASTSPAGNAPAVDSIWLVHRSRTLLDRSPVCDTSQGLVRLGYRQLPDYAVGDSVTVLIASGSLGAGRRYLAAGTRIIRTD